MSFIFYMWYIDWGRFHMLVPYIDETNLAFAAWIVLIIDENKKKFDSIWCSIKLIFIFWYYYQLAKPLISVRRKSSTNSQTTWNKLTYSMHFYLMALSFIFSKKYQKKK